MLPNQPPEPPGLSPSPQPPCNAQLPSNEPPNTHQKDMNRQIFLANLPASEHLEDVESRLMQMFAPFGNIVTVRARYDRSKIPIAFITFREAVDVEQLRRVAFNYDGRRVRVEATRDRPSTPPPSGTEGATCEQVHEQEAVQPQPVRMNKVLLGGINMNALKMRHILRHCATFGRVLDIAVPDPGQAADPAILPPFTVLVEYEGEEEAKRAVKGMNQTLWAGWRVMATLTSMPMPDC